MKKIAGIFDFGISNVSSVINSINFLGIDTIIIKSKKDIVNSTHLILPGQGSFDSFMEKFNNNLIEDDLNENVIHKKKPILGICLGMQLFCELSEEGSKSGLNLIKAKVEKLSVNNKFKIPNIGFQKIFGYNACGLFKDINENDAFYFLHSYAIKKLSNNKINHAYSLHTSKFICAFQNENICGVQFHPEKSQISGIKLLNNFFNI